MEALSGSFALAKQIVQCDVQSVTGMEAVMHELCPLAYSLSQQEDGWRWTVYDTDGVTIADGANISLAGAQQAVNRTLNAASGSDEI